MTDRPAGEPTFKLVGGHLCLDLTNTVGNRDDPARRRDRLGGYADLVAWAQQAGIVGAAEADRLRREARRRPAEAEVALGRAKELREAVHAVALAMARGRAADPRALAVLNGFVGELLAASRLVPAGAGYALERPADPAALDGPLWPVVRSAIALFTSEDPGRIRECAGHPCGWLFLDTSRGGRRRWCDMADCGNAAKVRRYRARHAAA